MASRITEYTNISTDITRPPLGYDITLKPRTYEEIIAAEQGPIGGHDKPVVDNPFGPPMYEEYIGPIERMVVFVVDEDSLVGGTKENTRYPWDGVIYQINALCDGVLDTDSILWVEKCHWHVYESEMNNVWDRVHDKPLVVGPGVKTCSIKLDDIAIDRGDYFRVYVQAINTTKSITVEIQTIETFPKKR